MPWAYRFWNRHLGHFVDDRGRPDVSFDGTPIAEGLYGVWTTGLVEGPVVDFGPASVCRDGDLVCGPVVDFDGASGADRRTLLARLVAFATKGRLPRKAHAGLNANCGVGPRGFLPGNTCGKRAGAHGTGRGGTQKHRKALAAKIRTLRGLARTSEQRQQLAAALRTLKAHERGVPGASAEAAKIRRAIHAGKVPKVAVAPKLPRQPTARERIQAAVAAKRAGRGLTAAARKNQAEGLRRDRTRKAEVQAKAGRAQKIQAAVAAKAGTPPAGRTLKPAREAAVELHRARLQQVLSDIQGGGRPLKSARRLVGDATSNLTSSELQELHRRLGFGKVAVSKAERAIGAAIQDRLTQTPAHPDLRRRLARTAFEDQRAATREWLDEQMSAAARAGPPVAQQVHGMPTAEAMHRVEVDGIAFHVADSGVARQNAEAILSRVAAGKPLPAALTRHTRNVYFSAQDNARDDYWQTQYQDFTRSAATGGSGNVVFYSGGNLETMLTHELGHNLAEGRYGSSSPRAGGDFHRAIASGEPPPTDYARNNASEDFAESTMLFIHAPDTLKTIAPRRFAVLEKLMQDPRYAG